MSTNVDTPVWALQITEADHHANEFRCLGGAAWPTKAERDAAYAAIPESETSDRSTDDFTWIVDLLAEDGWSIVGDREIDKDVVLALLGGDSIEELRAAAVEREAAAMVEAGRILEARGEPNPYAEVKA
jgi:hypothetical protein